MCVREVSCFFGWGDVFQYTTRGVTKSITNSALIYGSLHVDGVTARGASGWLDSGGSWRFSRELDGCMGVTILVL